MYKNYFKRLIDIFLSVSALVILSPVVLVTAVLVRVKLGSPAIFRQERPGKDEKIFTMFKFRTMTDAKDERGEMLPDEVRLTGFGKFLRSFSLDELPELVNIIKGDMSIIGPRPLLVQYLPYYDEFQKRRHEVRPGLTGLAQINGRNLTTWNERFEFDIQYIDSISFVTDVKIFFATIGKVFKREGVSAENHATMESFVDYAKRTRGNF